MSSLDGGDSGEGGERERLREGRGRLTSSFECALLTASPPTECREEVSTTKECRNQAGSPDGWLNRCMMHAASGPSALSAQRPCVSSVRLSTLRRLSAHTTQRRPCRRPAVDACLSSACSRARCCTCSGRACGVSRIASCASASHGVARRLPLSCTWSAGRRPIAITSRKQVKGGGKRNTRRGSWSKDHNCPKMGLLIHDRIPTDTCKQLHTCTRNLLLSSAPPAPCQADNLRVPSQ